MTRSVADIGQTDWVFCLKTKLNTFSLKTELVKREALGTNQQFHCAHRPIQSVLANFRVFRLKLNEFIWCTASIRLNSKSELRVACLIFLVWFSALGSWPNYMRSKYQGLYFGQTEQCAFFALNALIVPWAMLIQLGYEYWGSSKCVQISLRNFAGFLKMFRRSASVNAFLIRNFFSAKTKRIRFAKDCRPSHVHLACWGFERGSNLEASAASKVCLHNVRQSDSLP